MYKTFKEDSIYAKIVNEARYLNMTVMFIVQSALSVPDSLREGGSIVFCKRVNDKNETRVLADILNLTTKEQADSLMYLKLPDGIFINKEKGSIPVSILTQAYPTVRATDEDINRHQEKHLTELLRGIKRKSESVNNNTQEKPKEERKEGLSYNTNLVLQDLIRFPFDFQSERSVRLNTNSSILTKCLTELIELKIISKSSEKINLGKGKSPFQPYLLTDTGLKKYGKQRIKGKGSIKHAFWQSRCAKYFQIRGYETEIEYFFENGLSSVDVVAKKGNERIAIEIELNKTDHIRQNILKCLNTDFSLIIIAVYGVSMKKYVENMLLINSNFEENHKNKRIEIKMLPEFLV